MADNLVASDQERRLKIERALNENERQFRLLVESVVDYAIFMLDVDGRIITWNSGAARIKGFGASEIIGQDHSRFYTEEDRNNGLPALALKSAREHGRHETDGWRVRKDGSRFWANVVVEAIRDPDGDLIGFSKITRDVTERKEAQARDARFQRVVETAPNAIVMINSTGLTGLGYQALEAHDGPEAIATLERAGRIDLLFTDVVLPKGMNGTALAREARRRKPELKVLYMSGYTANAIVHHGVLDKGVHLLTKPFRKVELARKVRQVLDDAT